MKAEDPVARLWRRVDKSGDCWVWTGSRLPDGYGQIRVRHPRRYVRVHRFSWELANGPVPAGMHVLHRCDNPPCVRPTHLYVGTNADNMRDKAARRRSPDVKGHRNPKAKLTPEHVAEIRAVYRIGGPVGRKPKGSTRLSAFDLARKYGVTPSTIYHVARGWTWSE